MRAIGRHLAKGQRAILDSRLQPNRFRIRPVAWVRNHLDFHRSMGSHNPPRADRGAVGRTQDSETSLALYENALGYSDDEMLARA